MSRNSRFIDSKSIDSRIGVSRKILKKREGEEKTKKGREKKKEDKKEREEKREPKKKKREGTKKGKTKREREGERGNRIEFLVSSSSSPPPPPRSITFDEFQRVETVARCGYNFIQFFIADMLNW